MTDVQLDTTMSPTIGALAAALSKAQGDFEHAKKDVENTFFKSRYANLASVIDAARKDLAKNGLAVVQTTKTHADGKVTLITTLAHASGEWIRGEYPLNPTKSDPQGLGSAFSYGRRYAFSAITGIAADDDDGNAASGNNQKEPVRKSVFTNASLRNTFIQNTIAAYESCETKDELNTVIELNKPKFAEMRESGHEHDALAVDELQNRYKLRLTAIQKAANDAQQAADFAERQ